MLACLPLWLWLGTTACSERECGQSSIAPAHTLVVAERQIDAFDADALVFNPLRHDGDLRWAATNAMYEPLAIYNPMTHAAEGDYLRAYEARLAVHWQIDAENDRIEFELRDAVEWSDGRRFRGRDVVRTFELLALYEELDPQRVSDDIDGVFVEDSEYEGSGETVVFQLRGRSTLRFHEIAQQAIVPAHIWNDDLEHVDEFANSDPVATGPFVEVVAKTPEYYEVARNPNYWGPTPAIERIRLPALRDNVQANCALNAGQVDWAGDFIADVQQRFVGADPDFHRSWAAEYGGGTVSLRTRPDHPFLGDPDVRRAIALALAPEPIVRSAMNGLVSEPTPTGLADVLADFQSDEALERAQHWFQGDHQRANEILDDAGWPKNDLGKRHEALRFVIPEGYTDWVVAAEAIFGDQFGRIGIDIRVEHVEESVWENAVVAGEGYDLTMRWTFLAPTPYHYYSRVFPEVEGDEDIQSHPPELPCDAAGESEREVSDLLASLRTHHDPEDEAARCLIDALQLRFIADVPSIPLYVGGAWAQYNTAFFQGFPDEDDPYAPGTPLMSPQSLLVLDRLRPRPRESKL